MKLQGMTNNYKIKLLDGKRKTVDDGVVIRQSYVKDGKVVIPAAGLYTTSRCSNWWSFNDHVFTIAGKKYHFITDEYQQDVVKNVTMKPGDIIFGNEEKTRGWELKAIDPDPFGIEGGHMAYFWLIKTTGNYYGNPFIVVGGKNVKPSASDGSLLQTPAQELKALRGEAVTLVPNATLWVDPCFELTAAPLDSFCLTVAEGLVLTYHEPSRTVSLQFTDPAISGGRDQRHLELDIPCRSLQVVADTSSLEIFLNGGSFVMSTRYFPAPGPVPVRISDTSAALWPLALS